VRIFLNTLSTLGSWPRDDLNSDPREHVDARYSPLPEKQGEVLLPDQGREHALEAAPIDAHDLHGVLSSVSLLELVLGHVLPPTVPRVGVVEGPLGRHDLANTAGSESTMRHHIDQFFIPEARHANNDVVNVVDLNQYRGTIMRKVDGMKVYVFC
jgi:hypothetical protein